MPGAMAKGTLALRPSKMVPKEAARQVAAEPQPVHAGIGQQSRID